MKIKPNKYTNTDISVIGLSAEIINILKNTESEKYDNLLRKVISKRGDYAKKNFIASLILLYCLGKLTYYKDSDMLVLDKK